MPSRISLLLVFAAAVLGNLNALSNGFVFDDRQAVVQNAHVTRGEFSRIWTAPSWFAEKSDLGWRPVTTSSFALDWAVHGPAPAAWRFENILLHGANAVLVVVLIAGLGAAPFAALAAGLIFALHPIHTEVLNPIVGRGDLLATLCVLLCCWAYLVGRWTVGLLVFSAGLFMKESVISLLPLLPLLDLWKDKDWRALPGRLPRYLAFAGVLAGYLIIRHGVTGEWLPGAGTTAVLDNPLVGAGPAGRVSNALYVLWRYVLLLLVPWPLSADYSFDAIPVLSALSPRNLLAIGLLTGLGGAVWRWRRAAPQAPLLAALFLASFLLVSNLPFPIGVMMAERFMYLPSIAFCGLLGLALDTLFGGRASWALAAALLAGYGWLGFARNQDWKDDASVFLRSLETSPRSVRVMVNAGQVMLDQRRFQEARDLNLAALAMGAPQDGRSDAPAGIFPLPYSNLGIAYMRLGELAKAEAALQEALKRDPQYLDAWVNLGIVFAMGRRLDGAITAFEKAAAMVPDPGQEPHMPKLYYNLALALKQKADFIYNEGDRAGARNLIRKAKANYEKALALSPSYEEARRSLAALQPLLSK